MNALLLSAVAFVALPAPDLAATLGSPDYQTRELAHALLARQIPTLPAAALPAFAAALRAQAARPVNPEARRRVTPLLARAEYEPVRRAVERFEALGGGQYPYSTLHPYGRIGGADQRDIPEWAGPDYREWHTDPATGRYAYCPHKFPGERWATREWAHNVVRFDPAAVDEVEAVLREMWRESARYHLKTNTPWTYEPAPFLIEAFRWDRPVVYAWSADSPVPEQMPAP